MDNWRIVFVAVGLIGIIAFCVPSLMWFVPSTNQEQFSELYVLGSSHLAQDYPFNVSAGKDYTVYVVVEDHLRSAAYYQVAVKLRNSSEPLPNVTASVASPLPALCSYHVFLGDGQAWEGALNFSFSNVTFGQNVSSVGRVRINDTWIGADETAVWDAQNSGYFYQLFVELWLYNATTNSSGFHNRFVALWLNMTTGF